MKKYLSRIILFLLAVFLVIQAAYSLKWPIAHDEAPLLYEAFVMRTEGRIPYLNIFDFQMPGSFAAYYALGRLSGFNAFHLRILDLVILAALILITYSFMRRFGKTSALAAGLLFGLKYLQGGPSLSLQRDYLLIVFIACAIWMGMRDSLTLKHRFSLGILFGLAAIIKPHAAIGLLPFLLFDISDMFKRQSMSLINAAINSILPALIGFAIPVGAAVIWLVLTNSLTPFIQIAMNYWPLYAQINGQMEVTAGAGRISFLLEQAIRLGGSGLWLIPAAVGIYLNQNKQTYLLASLALCYAIYPALSGQFFPYHYIPFIYLIVLLASLSISVFDVQPWTLKESLPVFVFLAVVFINVRPSQTFMRQLDDLPIATSTDRAGEIAFYLEKHLEAGDTVQPLDWTGGTLLAMLESHAHLATPYVFDFYFYHHISNPYIQSLRNDFMKDLTSASPRFIVEVTAIDKPWVTGPDTSRDFPELRAFLNENYSITIHKPDYVIYQRK